MFYSIFGVSPSLGPDLDSMKIDLHNHTKYSDGVDTPQELFISAKKNKVDIFALTDHDSVFGCEELLKLDKKDDIRIKEFFTDKYECLEYENPLFYDKETFISRSLSGSYSLKSNDEGFDEYVTELRELFDEYAVDGIISMPNKTVVYMGTIKE